MVEGEYEDLEGFHSNHVRPISQRGEYEVKCGVIINILVTKLNGTLRDPRTKINLACTTKKPELFRTSFKFILHLP